MSPSLRHELSENNTFVSPVPVVIPGCVSQDFWLHIIEINWISSLKPKRTNHVFTHGTSSQFSKTGQSCAWTLQGISQELCTKPWGVSVEEGRGEEGRAGRMGGGWRCRSPADLPHSLVWGHSNGYKLITGTDQNAGPGVSSPISPSSRSSSFLSSVNPLTSGN